jgi:hypothetical protein
MSPPSLSPPSLYAPRARAWLIAATFFISCAYFYQGTGWNQNSHFDLARALAEQHSVRIDRYERNTGDKALYQGHYYSDKAPGLSLAALPAISAAGMLARVFPVSRVPALQLYLATILTSSLAIALAAAVLFLMLLNLNIKPGAAAFAVAVFGLGTPMWIYATQFWGHALASACLVFAFAAADGLQQAGSSTRHFALAAAVGMAAGWAVVTEFPAAIPAVMIGVMALVYCWRSASSTRNFLCNGAALCFTAGLCLATILIYQKAAFGSPSRLGYEYVVNYQDTLQHGALGLTYPKWHPLIALLLGKRCGLLLFAPILVVAPFGLRRLWRSGLPRLSLCVSAGIAVYYLLFNASYLHWQAGASFGPRYLSPGLPFACLFVAPVWERSRPAIKALLAGLATFGVGVALAGVATRPVIPEAVTFPIKDALQEFARGEMYQQGGAWNLGSRAGLHGMMSLMPLLAMWAIAAAIWWRMARNERQGPGGFRFNTRSSRSRAVTPCS